MLGPYACWLAAVVAVAVAAAAVICYVPRSSASPSLSPSIRDLKDQEGICGLWSARTPYFLPHNNLFGLHIHLYLVTFHLNLTRTFPCCFRFLFLAFTILYSLISLNDYRTEQKHSAFSSSLTGFPSLETIIGNRWN